MIRSGKTSARRPRPSRLQTARLMMESCESRVMLAAQPVGSVDIFTGAEIAGWAWDSAFPAQALTVRITIDGAAHDVTANQSRSDLRSVTGTDKVGFFYVPTGLSTGSHNVTIAAIDPSNSQPVTLKTGTIKSGPIGVVDTLNGALIAGWTFSSFTPTSSLTMHVTIDGTTTTVQANSPRPDAGGPLGNPNIGFFYDPPALSAGKHNVTVAVVDPQTGSDLTLATGQISSDPVGIVDIATLTHSQGWVYDPHLRDTPVPIKLVVDGNTATTGTANASRPDIAVAFNGNGYHGYSLDYSSLGPGTHTVQLVEVNADNSTTVLTTQTLKDQVVGNIDIADSGTIAGWAFDAFAPSSAIQVVVNLDGTDYPAISANQDRPDLTALPDTHHGFYGQMPTNLTGTHIVKVYGINPDTGARELIGQRQFINNAPTGAIEVANASHVSGYAFDPDFPTTSISVLLEIDGAIKAQVVASNNRPDLVSTIGSADHGFDISLSSFNLSSGSHTVDIKGVDPATGVTSLVGTQMITV
ncbi:MAG TPA: hypothetical protein VM008_20805 [Phycisphaerae bacterium]|nr:hypothetical protein [Phycisphaerae bacterium]